MMDLFDFAVSWAEAARDTHLVLAGVLPKAAHSRKQVMFGDTVAYNRGLVSRAFDDIEQARAWLRNAGK